MRQTIFHIPHELFGQPVLGFGLALFVWLAILLVIGGIISRSEGVAAAAKAVLPYAIVGSLVMMFLLPRLQESAADGTILGLPVRGYGLLMFFAVVAAVALAVRSAAQRGIHPDYIYGLGVWMFVAGFAGARLFFVYQYRDQFRSASWSEFLGQAVNIAEGGLVVYGSLIGALLAYLLFVWRHKLPALVFADLLAPSMLLGLAIGRIGCLMNGCCYGGPCDHAWAIQFPQESPPYMNQLQTGLSHGFHIRPGKNHQLHIAAIDENSPAAQAGLAAGTRVAAINDVELTGAQAWNDAQQALTQATCGSRVTLRDVEGHETTWTADYAPERSLPTHPAQIYSSLNAFILCGLVLAAAPYLQRDGALLALTLTVYPVTRFLLEIIRQDELAVNGLGFTISQTISWGILALGIILWMVVWRQPVGRQQALLPQ